MSYSLADACRPISSLLPDSLIARKATQDFNSYLDSQVARTLSLPADELKKRQNSLTLMEALALQRPEPKVCSYCFLYMEVANQLVHQKSTYCRADGGKGWNRLGYGDVS